MITSFEVGAIFRVINDASPALRKILADVRQLNAAIEGARKNLAEIAKPASMGTATAETGDLAKAWGDVAKNATAARAAIGSAARAALPASAAVMTGGGGGRHRPRWLGGGGGGQITGPGVTIPGGGHVRFGGGAAAAAGLVGYGAFEAAEMSDAVAQLIYHSGLEYNDANRKRFHDIISESVRTSGYSLHDVAEAAKQEIRMFQGTPGGGLDVLPDILRAATIEARLKGESPEEAAKAMIGLAHMTKEYDPDSIRKLAPAFAFLSTANPDSLGSIEKAAGYAVPLLQSGMDVDPVDALLLGTALTRAGATSTKSGSWLREMAVRALPGSTFQSRKAFEAHEAALQDFGLVDDKGKPTWLTPDGKPDLFKMLAIASAHAADIPPERRASDELAVFGRRGGGALALLSDPAVRAQILALRNTMNSPEFKNRYAGFQEFYNGESSLQQARIAVGDCNMLMADLGAHTLPTINHALGDFRSLLDAIRNSIPGATKTDSVIGARALEGAIAGGAVGLGIAGVGAIPGALVGGIVGGVEGVAETYLRNHQDAKADRSGNFLTLEGRSAPPGGTGVFPGGTSRPQLPPLHINLNVDGRQLASAVSENQSLNSTYETSTPASNGSEVFGP